MSDLQTELLRCARGSIMALDSAADILPRNRGCDVLVTASYIGVLPARLVRATVGLAAAVRGVFAGLRIVPEVSVPTFATQKLAAVPVPTLAELRRMRAPTVPVGTLSSRRRSAS